MGTKNKKLYLLSLIVILSLLFCGCDAHKNIVDEDVKIQETEETIIAPTIEQLPIEEPTNLQRTVLTNPKSLIVNDMWTLGDNYLYFGKYNAMPMLYRVLGPASLQTIGDGEYLLLDCRDGLLELQFDSDNKKNDGQHNRQNEWPGSDLQVWLNGNDFYENTDVFSKNEKGIIAETTLQASDEDYIIGKWSYSDLDSVDRVFMLSAQEANTLYAGGEERTKRGSDESWWLRSVYVEAGNGAGTIHSDGHICNNSVNNKTVGVSPTFNIDLEDVIFVTSSLFDKTNQSNESQAKICEDYINLWKLTVADMSLHISVMDETVKKEGKQVKLQLAYEGEDINQISVVFMDKEYSRESNVLYYAKILLDKNSSVGSFDIPDELLTLQNGKDYFTYIIAEIINEETETDYCSNLQAISFK